LEVLGAVIDIGALGFTGYQISETNKTLYHCDPART
jgi:hypothetical protein